MVVAKKLIFAPLFLLSFTFLLFQLEANLSSYNIIFSVSVETFINLLIFSALISLSSILFILFVSLAGDLKIILPVGLIALALPPTIIDPQTGLILSIGMAICLLITYFNVSSKLKNYLTFEPTSLFGPSIRSLVGLLILVFSFTYFLSINKVIAEKGFEIPESLIDSALKFMPAQSSEKESLPKLAISSEQLALLKQNPDLLKQSGLDPKVLDSLDQPKTSNPTQDLVKATLQTQVQTMIKPYMNFIPTVLAVLFFIVLQSITSLINILISPLLLLTFFILEKTKYIKFTEEQRTVRKMVV